MEAGTLLESTDQKLRNKTPVSARLEPRPGGALFLTGATYKLPAFTGEAFEPGHSGWLPVRRSAVFRHDRTSEQHGLPLRNLPEDGVVTGRRVAHVREGGF